MQDICLVSDPEQAQQVVPEDHHSNPTNSRRGSIENSDIVRPSLDNIRRCSLDQTFSALNPNTDSLHNARRASIDNGLMIWSALDQTGKNNLLSSNYRKDYGNISSIEDLCYFLRVKIVLS